MRIIAGEFKGRRLAPVKGRIRPTRDKVREDLFSILGPEVEGAAVLDLFAGTGALALEALSRGAREAVLVEDQAAALEVLRRNLETLGVAERTRVLPVPVQRALNTLAGRGEKFNLVFLDPPYGSSLAVQLLTWLGNHPELLKGPRLVILQQLARESVPEKIGALRAVEHRRVGEHVLRFFTLAAETEGSP